MTCVQAIEAKRVIGNYDTSLYLKEQVDVLRGRNEEIRAELRESRVECNKLQMERDKAFERVRMLFLLFSTFLHMSQVDFSSLDVLCLG